MCRTVQMLIVYLQANVLLTEFEMYSIIEFTTKTMGPLYIYRKDIFEKLSRNILSARIIQNAAQLVQ